MNTIPQITVNKSYPDAPLANYDPLTVGDGLDGVRFVFDLGFAKSYPGGPIATRAAAGDPVDGQPVYNITRQGAGDGNGDIILATENGSTMPFSNGGIDLSNTTISATYGANGVRAPAAACADIWNAAPAGSANVGASQHFLIAGYFKIPTTGNWPAGGTFTDLIACSNLLNGYSSGPEMVTIGMQSGSPYQVSARRQVAAATVEATTLLQPVAGDYGGIVQLAYWRNAAGSVFRLKSAAGTVISAATVFAANTQNFSALRAVWGNPMPFTPGPAGYVGAKVYRGFIENLARSGRSPASVLDADWTRVKARIDAGQFA